MRYSFMQKNSCREFLGSLNYIKGEVTKTKGKANSVKLQVKHLRQNCGLRSFVRFFSRTLQHVLADEWHNPAVKSVSACIVAGEQDDEAEEDVCWIMRYSACQEEREVHD